MSSSKAKIKALINLLDDPNPEIFSQVRRELLELGHEAIEQLENFWEHNNYEPEFRKRIENLIHDIQFSALKRELSLWAKNPVSLLEGALLINRFRYPETDKEEIELIIGEISKKIWLELNEQLTALETVKLFNKIFYQTVGFKGDRKHFHSPNNSYLKDVLVNKRGNPLSLSIVYIILSNRLKLPICGVNLPSHFVLAYTKTINHIHTENKDDVLFYINPFSKGSLLHKTDIDDFLKQLKVEPQPYFYIPCNNLEMIKRMLVNLIYSYSRQGEQEKVSELQELEAIIKEHLM